MFAKKNTSPGATPPAKSSRFDHALKWVTALTALLSLFFAVQKVTQTLAENAARSRQLSELMRVADMQQQAMDYSRAWDSLATASQLAESGDAFAKLLNQHAAEIAQVHTQRENLAMAWLMNISVPEGQKFSEVVDKFVPVLERGTGTASSQRNADLLAHIGWSYFLRNRDGSAAFDPSQHYVQAIAFDAQNPYAHAYWAHWILWQRGDADAARAHFAKALDSNRARERVRGIQLIAFHNLGEAGETPYLAIVAEMIKNGEAVPADFSREALWLFERACSNRGQALLIALKAQIGNTDLASTYEQITAQLLEERSSEHERCLTQLKSS